MGLMERSGAVAIVTRTKNRPLLLERALMSALSQTYANWRLVIVNDGGDPGPVRELVDLYACQLAGRVTIVENETPVGMQKAANQGIQAVDSEYVVLHDDDDSWAPNFLLMSINELRWVSANLPSVKGVVCYSRQVVERIERGVVVTERTEALNSWIPQGLISFADVAEQNVFPPVSFLFRRDALDTVGLYDEALLMHSDWDFNLRFLSQYDIAVLPYALAFCHVRPDAVGEAGNFAISRRLAHEGYEQYLRNELLRRDMRASAASLGTVVLLARRIAALQQVIEQHENGDEDGRKADVRAGWRPGWAAASAVKFLRSDEKRTLMTKFARHWRNESPRRALAVAMRWGYLALGGK